MKSDGGMAPKVSGRSLMACEIQEFVGLKDCRIVVAFSGLQVQDAWRRKPLLGIDINVTNDCVA